MTRAAFLTLAVAGLAAAVGCVQDLEARQFQTRVVDADPDTVLSAAEVVLRREFGRVAVDRAARRITSGPVEFTTASDSGSTRDLYGGRSSMRRIVTASVSPRGERSVLRMRVDVERQDTARRNAVPSEGTRISDAPAYDPVDRDRGLTREQSEVWTFVRRDRALERALLEEVQDQFAREPPPQPSTGERPLGSEPPPETAQQSAPAP